MTPDTRTVILKFFLPQNNKQNAQSLKHKGEM